MRYAPLVFAVLTAAPVVVSAQGQPSPLVSFGVDYRGGDTRLKPVKYGHLLLSDSMIIFTERYSNAKDAPLLVIQLSSITGLNGAVDRKGTTAAGRAIWGGLAPNEKDDVVTISYDGPSDAEAPVFVIEPNRSAEFVAKVNYRLRKLGRPLADSVKP